MSDSKAISAILCEFGLSPGTRVESPVESQMAHEIRHLRKQLRTISRQPERVKATGTRSPG